MLNSCHINNGVYLHRTYISIVTTLDYYTSISGKYAYHMHLRIHAIIYVLSACHEVCGRYT
jgi:hypothetical protein